MLLLHGEANILSYFSDCQECRYKHLCSDGVLSHTTFNICGSFRNVACGMCKNIKNFFRCFFFSAPLLQPRKSSKGWQSSAFAHFSAYRTPVLWGIVSCLMCCIFLSSKFKLFFFLCTGPGALQCTGERRGAVDRPQQSWDGFFWAQLRAGCTCQPLFQRGHISGPRLVTATPPQTPIADLGLSSRPGVLFRSVL